MNTELLEKQLATLKAELQWIAALTISTTDHQNNTNRLLNVRDRAALALDKTANLEAE